MTTMTNEGEAIVVDWHDLDPDCLPYCVEGARVRLLYQPLEPATP